MIRVFPVQRIKVTIGITPFYSTEYKSELKDLVNDDWISTDIIKEYVNKGAEYDK